VEIKATSPAIAPIQYFSETVVLTLSSLGETERNSPSEGQQVSEVKGTSESNQNTVASVFYSSQEKADPEDYFHHHQELEEETYHANTGGFLDVHVVFPLRQVPN
jgi:hypothetical protein